MTVGWWRNMSTVEACVLHEVISAVNEHADMKQDGHVCCMFISPYVFMPVCTLYPLLQVFREESWKHQLRKRR